MKAPTTEGEALVQLADDLRRDNFDTAAAVIDAGYRNLAGAVEHELLVRRADRVTVAMARAWGAGNDTAVLAGYRSLYAPETDGDEDVALVEMAAVPTPVDVAALVRNEVAHHCRTLLNGGACAARVAAIARTVADWADVTEAVRTGVSREADAVWHTHLYLAVTAMVRGELDVATGHCAALAHVSPETWLSSTRTMIEMDAAATQGAAS